MNSPEATRRRARGFTLLEAMVAMVLLASVGAVVLTWIHQSVQSVQRLNRVYDELAARKTVQDWSRSLNPSDTPAGEAALGPLRIVWESKASGEALPQAGYPSGIGMYDIAKYQVVLKVYRPDAPTPWFTENIVRLGQRKTRDNRSPFQN